MEFKKCPRCGNFFLSDEPICYNCVPKDKFEMSRLITYFEENDFSGSIDTLAANTGISQKNLNRYLDQDVLINLNGDNNWHKMMSLQSKTLSIPIAESSKRETLRAIE